MSSLSTVLEGPQWVDYCGAANSRPRSSRAPVIRARIGAESSEAGFRYEDHRRSQEDRRELADSAATESLDSPIERVTQFLSGALEGLSPADRRAMNRAALWLSWLWSGSTGLDGALTPNLTVSPDGDVVAEWWVASRKLTVYFSDSGSEFIKVWGTDILDEMEEGDAEQAILAAGAWAWLTAG